MKGDIDVQMNNIGKAIQYFRDSYQITQTTLSKGLCSVATLSRIEAGARDVDALLLETLLERLGKEVNQFELIIADTDYIAYQNREAIIRQINAKNYDVASKLLDQYEEFSDGKSFVHKQFVIANRALLNHIRGGERRLTIELLMDAITCTVPDFKTNEIGDYYLSKSEINIIIDLIEHMLSGGMVVQAKKILEQVLEYLENHSSVEDNNLLYPKVVVIGASAYIEESAWQKVYELVVNAIEKKKGSRTLEYYGELYLLKAHSLENIYSNTQSWPEYQKVCIKLFLQSYYVFQFLNNESMMNLVKDHLKEVYQWVDIV